MNNKTKPLPVYPCPADQVNNKPLDEFKQTNLIDLIKEVVKLRKKVKEVRRKTHNLFNQTQ